MRPSKVVRQFVADESHNCSCAWADSAETIMKMAAQTVAVTDFRMSDLLNQLDVLLLRKSSAIECAC